MSNWTTKNFRAKDLTNQIKEKTIKVPHYQRGQVWKYNQKDKLIDSIKKGFPFGTIFLYKKEDNTYQLIDGLQRASTVYEFLHSPAKFFKEDDISNDAMEKIYDLLAVGWKNDTKYSKLVSTIQAWVVSKHDTMEDVKNIDAIECAKCLREIFPTCTPDAIIDIASILGKEFQVFRTVCEELSNIEIPAIIYQGNPENLPEVFTRINSKGTTLSKYQILSATWTAHEYRLVRTELEPIIQYVDNFYVSIIDNHFDVDGYTQESIHQTKKLNLYQILFGFSKLLSSRFPYLFSKSKNDEEIESCAFNLVNTCLGNKNSKLADLPTILEQVFNNNDNEINDFLVNILLTIENIYKILKPYLEFKLNKRDSSISIYHTEFQICSMIANYFNARYSTYSYDNKTNLLIGRSIKLDCSNNTYDTFRKNFKRNAFKKYLMDIINDNWRGSGDKKMDEVSLNYGYYTIEISKEMYVEELEHWFNQMNANLHENSKVAKPKSSEKIMLSVIYSHSFSAFEQNDDINYDIEHLAPKGCLKMLLKNLPSKEGVLNGLPISSFANLCLLREEVNRQKKDKTLYQDDKYLCTLKEKNIYLKEIEDKFSFTTRDDLDWVNYKYIEFDTLKEKYYEFLHKRFEKQKRILIDNLFPNIRIPDSRSYQSIEKGTITYAQAVNFNKSDFNLSLTKQDPVIKEAVGTYNNYQEDMKVKLTGWQKELFDIIGKLPSSLFVLDDIYQHYDTLKKLYPSNNTIQASIRRTLQELEKHGLIEFVDNQGSYKRLWK